MNLKPVNEHLDTVTIEDIENHKLLSDNELLDDLERLIEYDASTNRNCFYGNPFLYHFQLKNLMRCRRNKAKTIYELNAADWNVLIEQTRKRNRGGKTAAGNVFECFRANYGSVVMFKATTAKYIYQKYGAKKVLDPTAGWGGRMLGAWALGIDYTGIDTNTQLIDAYYGMLFYLNDYPQLFKPKLEMIWDSCLNVDFSDIDYDFVLTSPPYINLELYENMTPFESEQSFYVDFLIPLWKKCCDNITAGGKVCFNISPKMYEAAKYHGLPDCDFDEDLKQQLGQQKNKKKQDKIYIWAC